MQSIPANPAEISENPPLAPTEAQQPRSRNFRTLRVIVALILRETGSRETRTSLGFLWTLIDPILAIILLSTAFSVIQHNPRLGTNFQLYYVTGIMPFQLYGHLTGRVATSIRYSGNLLGFPSVTVVDVLLSRFLLNLFTNLVVFVAALIWVVNYYDLRINPDPYRIGMSLSMAAALGLGLGTMNSVLFLWSSAYETFWGVLNRPMTMFAGVMFPISDLPSYIFDYLKWLPMAHIVAEMRKAFYPTADASFVSPAYVFGISGIAFVIGLIGLHRYVFDLLERR
jgi:capsular polysaccharide transport system permease protein